MQIFPKTVDLGLFLTLHAYKGELEYRGISFGDFFKDIFEKIEVSGERRELELVLTNPRELGFDKPTSVSEIHSSGLEKGYTLCPSELALALRLSFLDQPPFEYLTLAMNPLADGNGRLWCIAVCSNSTAIDDHRWVVCPVKSVMKHPRLHLRAYPGSLNHVYHPDTDFIFVSGGS